uniref:chaperone protein dnaJ 20, chloroplastic-like n=1 Tax=Erigeron canadensis TaxID=72917 RepID=UPI001CB8A423|nr:chaperone protein dnaJ 20, chloroplastic-like [Erigeron canadensis]
MALKYHPDVSPPDRVDEYTIRFIKVQEAYKILSDPKARAMYDNSIAKGSHLAFSKTHDEKAQWRESWQVQIAELQCRSRTQVGRDRRMSWAARIRDQRIKTGPYRSDTDQLGSI